MNDGRTTWLSPHLEWCPASPTTVSIIVKLPYALDGRRSTSMGSREQLTKCGDNNFFVCNKVSFSMKKVLI